MHSCFNYANIKFNPLLQTHVFFDKLYRQLFSSIEYEEISYGELWKQGNMLGQLRICLSFSTDTAGLLHVCDVTQNTSKSTKWGDSISHLPPHCGRDFQVTVRIRCQIYFFYEQGSENYFCLVLMVKVIFPNQDNMACPTCHYLDKKSLEFSSFHSTKLNRTSYGRIFPLWRPLSQKS